MRRPLLRLLAVPVGLAWGAALGLLILWATDTLAQMPQPQPPPQSAVAPEDQLRECQRGLFEAQRANGQLQSAWADRGLMILDLQKKVVDAEARAKALKAEEKK